MSTRTIVSSAIAVAVIAGGAFTGGNSVFAQSWGVNGADLFANPTTTRVGIGRNNPQVPLHIQTLGTVQLRLEDQNGSFDLQGGGDFNILRGVTNWMQFNTANTFVKIGPNSEVRINTTTGNVGLGTTTARNRLDVEGAAVIGATYSGTNTAPANGLLVEGPTYIGRITDPGGMGSPFQLVVQGTGFITAGVWSSSDMRLKENIAPIEGALSKVMNLQGVHYQWRRNEFPDRNLPEGTELGFVAQDLEKLVPEVVRTGSDGFKRVSYSNLTSLLVEAIKEQQGTIVRQSAENNEMKTRLDEQAARIARLEAAINGLSAVPRENSGSAGAAASLGQNDPNPTGDMTTISYTLPETASHGELVVSEMGSGREMMRIALTAHGEGEIAVPVKDIRSGNYIYSLIVDGKVMASRKMIVVK
jgi:hypothetical protein